MKRYLVLALFSLALAWGLWGVVSAHGAKIEYSTRMTVEIRAAYDTGEAMAGGQVTVYAPDDPATPWLEGVCDDQGLFTFTPDPTIPGMWDVQVRLAGHGDIVHIPIGEGTVASGSTGFTPLQIVLMAVAGVWGFVGTALYFSRRPTRSPGRA